MEKERQGAKVSKKYDRAKTPFQRVLLSEHISQEMKNSLTEEYESLDPVSLLAQLESLQDELWKYAWNKNGGVTDISNTSVDEIAGPVNDSRYYHTRKKVDFRKSPRTWRTRKDPFEKVWDEVRLRLELMPEMTAKQIIEWLMRKYTNQFSLGQTRTLQRRIAEWRLQQESQEEKLRGLMLIDSQFQCDNQLVINENTGLEKLST